jgi:hypothetical protein
MVSTSRGGDSLGRKYYILITTIVKYIIGQVQASMLQIAWDSSYWLKTEGRHTHRYPPHEGERIYQERLAE